MSNPMGDRNLLAGILAYQKKFISREVLVAAMNAWTQSKEKGLAQILREQKALTENQHALLEEAIYDQLAQHDNDAKKSLAALKSADPIKQELAKIADADLQASVAHVATAMSEVPIVVEEVVEIDEAPKKKLAAVKAVKVAVKKSAAPASTVPARKSAGGISVLALVVGGASILGGGFLALVALMGVGLAVFLLRGEKPIAQVKPDDTPIIRGKEENKGNDKPPTKEPDKGVKQAEPPIEAGPPIDLDPLVKPKDVQVVVPPVPDGFVPLFNGKDLTGWKPHKTRAGHWRVENGILVGSPSNNAAYFLQTEQPQPKDFHLRVEARIGAPGNGSVYFRFQPDGPIVGYEAMIRAANNLPDQVAVGGLGLNHPGKGRAFPGGIRTQVPAGQWFTLEVIAKGDRLIAKADGQTTMDVIDPTILMAGHVALGQIAQSPIEFRKIEIKELIAVALAPPDGALPFPVEAGFVPLFNGKDLTGWKERFAGRWRIDQGVLIGSAAANRMAVLHTDAKFKDFHLRAEVRSGEKNLAKLGFRSADGFLQGYNASMVSLPAGDIRVGIINADTERKGFTLPRLMPEQKIPPGQWFNLEVIAQGDRFRVLVNGRKITDAADVSIPDAGFISLWLSGAEPIEFRKIEIKEFKAVPPPPRDQVVVAPAKFVPLFNGKDLTGWKSTGQPARGWKVVDGILTGNGPNLDAFYTPRDDHGDFHLRMEARINDDGNSFVAFRYPHGAAELDAMILGGYAVRLNGRPNDQSKTGSLMVFDNGATRHHFFAKEALASAGQWFSLEVIAKGDRVETKINGRNMSFLNPKKDLKSGRIVLGLTDAKNRPTLVEFRKIEISELNNVVAAPPGDAPPFPVEAGFVSLFNGKDLTGWKTPPKQPGDWRVKDGVLTGAGAAHDTLFTTRSDFKDYRLRMEVRVNDGGRGSIFCRGPFGPVQPELNPLLPIGFQTEICNTPKELNRTGGVNIRYMGGVTGRNYQSFLQPGEWFTLEIRAEGNRVSSRINDRAAQSMVDQDRVFMSGTIGIYLGKAGTVLEFRKIEIKELAPVALAPLPPKEMPGKDAAPFPAAEEFVPLFNGKDLTAWKINGRQSWRVVGGVLTGSGAAGGGPRMIATSRADYGDFHLRLEARLNHDGNASVLFRYPYALAEVESMRVAGYELRLTNVVAYPAQTGTLYVYDKTGTRSLLFKERLVPPGTWFNLEVIAKGNQVDVLINGQKVNSFLNPNTHLMGGRIVLGYMNNLNRQTAMEYRKIEIKEFKAVAAPPQPPPPRPLQDFAPIFNGRDLTGWRVEGKESWKVNDAGELVGQGPDTAILTKRADYRNLIAKIELIASPDVEAYFGFRESQAPAEKVIGLTTRLTGDKGVVQAGRVGTGGTKAEVGNPRIQVKGGEKFLLEVHVTPDLTRISVNGTLSTAMAYPLDAHPPGAIGLHIVKGTVRIKKFDVSAEAPVGQVVIAPPPKEKPPAGMVPLFNGKDLTGWRVAGNDGWKVNEAGELVGQGPDTDLITRRTDYRNLSAKIELSASADVEAFFGFRETQGPGAKIVGLTSRLTGDGDIVRAGNSGNNGSKVELGKPRFEVKPGEVFLLEFHLNKNNLQMIANGKTTGIVIYAPASYVPGAIGLHIIKGKVSIKKFEISAEAPVEPVVIAPPPKEKPPAGVVPLFNGKDLAGWQPHLKRPGNWRVEKGILIGSAPDGGSLYSIRGDYQDFHLRAEVRINDKGFGRIFGRAAYDPTKIPFKVLGYEVLINQRPLGDKTGTLTAISPTHTSLTPAKESPAPVGDWLLVEVIAKGDLVTVKVNAKSVAEFRDERRQLARSGHIALHQDANATIEFRKVEIEDLSAP